MSKQEQTATVDVEAVGNDPHSMIPWSKEQQFSLNDADRDAIQLYGLRKRFRELAPRLPRVAMLADENRISELSDINSVVPLLFPHTEYKSYPVSLIDNCRFDLLNDWLNEFTIFDLSKLDVSNCQSIDEWLDVIEVNTPVRPLTSSGTTGKVSLLPRSTVEEKLFAHAFSAVYRPFRDEPGLTDIYAPDVYHVFPYARRGRHVTCHAIRAMVEHGFGGDESHVLTFGGEMRTDILWMTGRLKKAQADGTVEQLKKTKGWERLSAMIADFEAQKAGSHDDFYRNVLQTLKDKTVVIGMGLNYFLTMIGCAEKYGLEVRFAPDSILTAAGGLKGVSMSEAQIEKVESAFPRPLNEFYACSEVMSGLAQKCPKGHFHPPPWQVIFVLDPDTGVPYPRTGVQTGRYAGFDLWAETYWAGFITGDEVTVNWDGGCGCGRSGPYFEGAIARYSEKRGGDDKITCQRTAEAVQEMVEHMAAQRDETA